MSSFNFQTDRVAKKIHRCEWCAGEIPVGAKYRYMAGSWRGDFFHIKNHLECFPKVIASCDEYGEACTDTHKRGKGCMESHG